VCPICKWDCLPTDLRRERNHIQQQEEEQQQQQQNEPSHPENVDSTTINMPIPSPSTSVTPEAHHVENATRTTGSIIPPPILPASSPPPSPHISDQKITPKTNPFEDGENETSVIHDPAHHLNMFDQAKNPDDYTEQPKINPFDGTSSNISETRTNHFAESSSTPAYTSVAIEDENHDEKKKSALKD
jgi:hypothetical protein